MGTVLDRWLGPSVRRIHEKDSQSKTLYLTFDDGPDPDCTSSVLERLAALKVPATFFLIAQKAIANRSLLDEIQAGGHEIGNHSFDHRYGSFFSGRDRMLKWINHSEKLLSEALGKNTVGFRPPAGVRTPELQWALKQLEIPLVLWETRFFDTARTWDQARALRSLNSTVSGSIILLHDSQSSSRFPTFLETLNVYIREAQNRGFEFRSLTRALCVEAAQS